MHSRLSGGGAAPPRPPVWLWLGAFALQKVVGVGSLSWNSFLG